MEEILAIPREEALLCSAKDGTGVSEILEAIVKRIPAPTPLDEEGTSALIFDSDYDAYRGVVIYVRVFSGEFSRGSKIRLFSNGLESELKEVGIFSPGMRAVDKISAGSVGYLIPNIKTTADTRIRVKSNCPVLKIFTRWFSAEFTRLILPITVS
jgi:GTP-binding protein LepA